MTIDDYYTTTRPRLAEPAGIPACIVEGMLQFDETAAYFAGPFEGGFATSALPI